MKTILGDLIAAAKWDEIPAELNKHGFYNQSDAVAKYNKRWDAITNKAVAEERHYTSEEYNEIRSIENSRMNEAMIVLRGFINQQ